MDSFDNFQYDSASSYGGARSIVDDTSSIYTANTQDGASTLDLSSLSVSDSTSSHIHNGARNGLDEDFDGVLEDLKDEGAVDLPPHACRCVLKVYYRFQTKQNVVPVTAASIRLRRSSNVSFAANGFAILVATRLHRTS